MALQVEQVIPLVRILDEAKAREFYLDYLGFTVDWEHRYGGNFPLYMQISRSGMVLHLTEHYGDCLPGTTVFLRMKGLVDFHAEITGKDYKYYKPGLETTERNSRSLQLLDPFGNKLRLDEKID